MFFLLLMTYNTKSDGGQNDNFVTKRQNQTYCRTRDTRCSTGSGRPPLRRCRTRCRTAGGTRRGSGSGGAGRGRRRTPGSRRPPPPPPPAPCCAGTGTCRCCPSATSCARCRAYSQPRRPAAPAGRAVTH